MTENDNETVRDVVCGIQLKSHLTTYRALLDLKTYYFCSLKCQKEFDQNPNHYTSRNR